MNYEQQANDVANEMGLTLTSRYLGHMKHFENDEQERAVFECTIEKNDESYTFNFGQSVVESYSIRKGNYGRKKLSMFDVPFKTKEYFKQALLEEVKVWTTGNEYLISLQKTKPSMYDILTCLQKYEVGDIEEFCQDFGYDSDSITANAVHKKVADEYRNMCRLFTQEELEKLSEVQ